MKIGNRFKSLFNQYLVFYLAFFLLWQMISFYRYPVDYVDDLLEISLIFHGIDIAKKDGIEFAHFNNCKNLKKCSCKVIIHGIGDNYQNWHQVLKGIKKNDKVKGHWIAINYPGTGQSDPFENKSDFRVNKFASIINNKMKNICPGPYDVIANSMGTWISFWWAIQFPEQVKSLFLMDAVGIYSDYSWFANTMVNPTLPRLKELHKLGYHNVQWYPDQVYKNTLKNMIKRGNKNFILSQDSSLAIDKYLKDLKQKTFIGWGDSDKILPQSTYSQYLKMIPNVVGQIFKECGHVPNSECPEQVVVALERFYLNEQ